MNALKRIVLWHVKPFRDAWDNDTVRNSPVLKVLLCFAEFVQILLWVAAIGCLLLLLVSIIEHSACAAELSYRASAGEAWGITFLSDGSTKAPAPTTLVGLGLGYPVGGGWSVGGDVYVSVPRDAFHPSPRLTLGACKRWENFSLGLSGMYQWNPDYGKGETNMAGLTIGPGLAISKEIGLSFGFGWRALLSPGKPMANIISSGPTFTFVLPL